MIALALAISQMGCQAPPRTSRITVASAGRISSLDPAQASTLGATQLISALGDPLYRLRRDGSLEPRLAASPPVLSDGGRTVTVPLRTDVRFHDGTPFNAAAMAFSLRRFLEIGTLSYVVGDRIAAVEEADSHTLRLRLSRPSTSLQGLLTSINLTPISPTAYSNHQDRFLHDRFVGTGPYKLTRFSEHQQRLEPFAQYWGEAPRNNGLDLISLSNSTALYGALRSGEVDLLLSASIDEDQRHTLHERASAGELHESVGPAMEIGYITLLSNREPFQDPNLRRALAVSLNRSEISERVSYGLRRPLRALVPPSLAGGAKAPWPEHNPEQARELLQARTRAASSRAAIVNVLRPIDSVVPRMPFALCDAASVPQRHWFDYALVAPDGGVRDAAWRRGGGRAQRRQQQRQRQRRRPTRALASSARTATCSRWRTRPRGSSRRCGCRGRPRMSKHGRGVPEARGVIARVAWFAVGAARGRNARARGRAEGASVPLGPVRLWLR